MVNTKVLKMGMEKSGQKKIRVRWHVYGAVQGVGFRPFVFRLAGELGLTGWVTNTTAGIEGEVEGGMAALETFLLKLIREKPVPAIIHSEEHVFLDSVGYENFEIRASTAAMLKTAIVLPDLATCPACLRDIFDPKDRRYLYPFTNCTQCGPRYSIIEGLPYDRPLTSMKNFSMCPACQKEYEDPINRRFHAQPNACPACGPELAFWDERGHILAVRKEALDRAVQMIIDGKIVALKGLGGFQLLVDAGNQKAVQRLRERKQREEKPFALMFPSLEELAEECVWTAEEINLLTSSAAPIVLLRKKEGASARVVKVVSPQNPHLGAMLPYTPLHHILLRMLNRPVVATSGNISDEPICIDEWEALGRLSRISDGFLVHNRPIVRQVDDSIVRVVAGRPFVLRRARGYAPLPVYLKERVPSILGLGAQLKNTVTLSVQNAVFISQHVGDLSTRPSWDAFHQTITTLRNLYDAPLEKVACDLHPDYLSTREAKVYDCPSVGIQHHFAHIVSCMAENELDEEVLGVAWDGTGFGPDQTVWGGEFFLTTLTRYERVGHFRPFPLPGGEKAIKEPRRAAIGLIAVFGEDFLKEHSSLPPLRSFSAAERALIVDLARRQVHAPLTSSVGRLFDAVSSLLGLRQINHFEGQAAMELEFTLDGVSTNLSYDFQICARIGQSGRVIHVVDWEPMVRGIITDRQRGLTAGEVSAKFHNTLIEIAVAMARKYPDKKVVLSGGCFQNKYLLEGLIRRLQEEGRSVYWHQRVPTNDGGIALGQVVASAYQVLRGVGDPGLADGTIESNK